MSETELYDFTLVRFKHRGRKKKIEEMDIVPVEWLKVDTKNGNKLMTKYLDKEANNEDYALLHKLVEMKADPPEDWKYISVCVVGRAGKYQIVFY